MINETVHKRTKSLELTNKKFKPQSKNNANDVLLNSINKILFKKTNYIAHNFNNTTNYSTNYNSHNNDNNSASTTKRRFFCRDFDNIRKKYIFSDFSATYENLKQDSDLNMLDYKYESLSKKNSDNFDKAIENEFLNNSISKEKFSRTLRKSSLLQSINDDSQLKVSVNIQEYNSPQKAFSTIKRNEIIFDSMVQNYYEIQNKKYLDYVKKLENFENSNKKLNAMKIKITSTLPKSIQTNVETSNNSNNSHSRNNSNSNEDKKEKCKIYFSLELIHRLIFY